MQILGGARAPGAPGAPPLNPPLINKTVIMGSHEHYKEKEKIKSCGKHANFFVMGRQMISINIVKLRLKRNENGNKTKTIW